MCLCAGLCYINHRDTEDTEGRREMVPEETNRVSGIVVDAAIKVHRFLGPGLLESAYEACLAHELQLRGMQVSRQVPVSLVYEGLRLQGYRADMIVEGAVLVETKAQETIPAVYEAQTVSYLRLTGIRVGLLINFHVPLLKHGIKRFVNG